MSIGASVVIRGDIIGGEDLVILGRIEGSIRLKAGALMLAPGSHVVGDVAVRAAVIDGNVEGNVAAADRIELRPTAVIRGNVTAHSLVVADGAKINGRVEMPALARPHLVQSAAQLKVAV
jgi:cytoskeletal protein CcmA (bactofilin family)